MQDKIDKRLDIPAEANTEKHINFMEAEEKGAENRSDDNQFGHSKDDEKRREEWQKGLDEGEKARNNEQ